MQNLARIATLFIFTLMTANIAHASMVTLRGESLIDGNRVTLGDLFYGLDEAKAQMAFANAPEPGNKAIYDYRHLGIIATRYQIDWRALSVADQVEVRRNALEIPPEDIIAILEEALIREGLGPDLDISLSQQNMRIHLPVDAQPDLQIADLRFDRQRYHFSAQIHAGNRQVPVTGRAYELVSIPVVSRQMRKGDIIGTRDIDWQLIRTDRLTDSILQDEREIINKTPRRVVNAGQPIRSIDIKDPILVSRGDIVTISMQTGRIALTARGRALQNGAANDIIRVTNLMSNRIIEAVVSNQGEVRVVPHRSKDTF